MLKTILLTFLTIISPLAGATTDFGWVGFKQESYPAVPQAVKNSAGSVFQIISVDGEPEVKDVSKIDIKTMAHGPNDWMIAVQIKVCQNQKIKNCPILPNIYSGTAFLLRDQKTLATDLHIVQEWLYYAKKYNPTLSLENVQPPLVLADKNQNIVFAPITSAQTLKLTFYNKSPHTFAEPYDTGGAKAIFFRVSDYVELQMSEPMNAAPLKIAKITSPNDRLFVVGFPNPTHVFTKYGGIDSPGYDRWVSTGLLQKNVNLENINILSDIAGAPGSSGSPLLNGNGDVVAILFAGTSEESNQKLVVGSQFLQLDFNLMKTVWSEFSADGLLTSN